MPTAASLINIGSSTLDLCTPASCAHGVHRPAQQVCALPERGFFLPRALRRSRPRPSQRSSVDAVAETAPPITAAGRYRTATQPLAAVVINSVVIAVARPEVDPDAATARVPVSSTTVAAAIAAATVTGPTVASVAAPYAATIATAAIHKSSFLAAAAAVGRSSIAAAAADRSAATATARSSTAAHAGTAATAATAAATCAAATATAATSPAAAALTSDALHLGDQGVGRRIRRGARTSGLRGGYRAPKQKCCSKGRSTRISRVHRRSPICVCCAF
jgi:hypothetical protein